MSVSSLKKRFLTVDKLAKNSAILFFGAMGVNVLNYIFHLVIGRMVSVEVYGETESLLSLINIIAVPSAALSMVAAKYVAMCKAEGDEKGSFEIWKYLNKKILTYGIFIFIAAVTITPYVGKFLNIRNNFALILIWFTMFLGFFAAITSGTLRGWQKFKDISLMGIWGAVAKLVFAVLLVRLGFGLNGIVGSFLLGTIATYLALSWALRFIIAKKKEKNDDKIATPIDFKSLKRYVMPVFMGNLAITILGNADMILAKHNLDPISAGQYGALSVVAKIIFFATGVIGTVLFSMAAENHHKKSDTESIFRNASYLILGISFCAVAFYFLFPKFVLGMLFGSKYESVSGYLGWFAIMVTLYSYVNLMFQYLLSIHKTKVAYGLFSVSIILIVLILFTGHDIYGIVKVSIISQAAAIVVGFWFINKGKEQRDEDPVVCMEG